MEIVILLLHKRNYPTTIDAGFMRLSFYLYGKPLPGHVSFRVSMMSTFKFTSTFWETWTCVVQPFIDQTGMGQDLKPYAAWVLTSTVPYVTLHH
jgi:hypothetical protein